MWLQTTIRKNRARSLYLMLSFPLWLFVLIYAIFAIMAYNDYANRSVAAQDALEMSWSVFLLLWPVIVIWWLISFAFHRQLIFKFSWAKPIERKSNPEIYNIVENLAISRWLPVPKIGILEDDSMNAFALGRNKKNARVVFSRGLINKLDKSEIEAVSAHELTHIINKDSLVMTVIVVFIGIISILGEILIRISLRSGWWEKKWQATLAMLVVWIALLVLWYIFFPLMRLALSRKREFLADAGAVELTKDNRAMIGALRKISTDSRIESIKKATVAAMCIDDPFEKGILNADGTTKKTTGWGNRFRNLLATHPPIEKRIEVLEGYA